MCALQGEGATAIFQAVALLAMTLLSAACEPAKGAPQQSTIDTFHNFIVKVEPGDDGWNSKIFAGSTPEEKSQAHSKKLLCGKYYAAKINTRGSTPEQFIANLQLNHVAPARFHVDRTPLAITTKEPPPPGWSLKKVKAPDPKEFSKLGLKPPVVVAVIDTGVDYTHDHLAGGIWRNPGEKDFTNKVDDDGNGIVDDVFGAAFLQGAAENDPKDHDENGHGTHVAGLIAASGLDSQRGIAPTVAQVIALKILPADGGYGDVGDAMKAIDYAVKKGARVINLSWGGNGDRQELKDCIAHYPNVIFVAAAGNRRADIGVGPKSEPFYPATYSLPNMIVVAATDTHDSRHRDSNFSNSLVHIGAPGDYIMATNSSSTQLPPFSYFHRTSAAAPHVSAALALLIAQHPNWSVAQLKNHLLASADKIDGLKGEIQKGRRLNIANALSGPLKGVSHDLAADWKGGSAKTIRWMMSYQTSACPMVDLLWSSDGGATFPLALAASEPAACNGDRCERVITVPPGVTTQGVVRVQCSETRFSVDLEKISTLN